MHIHERAEDDPITRDYKRAEDDEITPDYKRAENGVTPDYKRPKDEVRFPSFYCFDQLCLSARFRGQVFSTLIALCCKNRTIGHFLPHGCIESFTA